MNKIQKVKFIDAISIDSSEENCFKNNEIKSIENINALLMNDSFNSKYTQEEKVQKFNDAVFFKDLIKELEEYRELRKA